MKFLLFCKTIISHFQEDHIFTPVLEHILQLLIYSSPCLLYTSIFNTEEKEISSTRIGEIVMEHLKDLDAVAYVRFASVYREFKDVSTFMDELKKFMN